MPIPWLTVLKAVPWTEVISNAPKVASGAKKLWDSIGSKPAARDETSAPTPPATLPELQAELSRQRSAVADLQQQMQASSEVIASLAEQNAQLIARVDQHRRQLHRAFAAIGVIGCVTLVLLFIMLGN